MRKIGKTIVTAAAFSLLLPGCSSVFGERFFSRNARPSEVPTSAQNAAVPAIAAAPATVLTGRGREQLAAGNFGNAIEAFQQAISAHEPPAAAFNGLGVAYAKLGRADLAQRYFEQAVAHDPANDRYAANLQRLQGRMRAQSPQQIVADPLARTELPLEVPGVRAPRSPLLAAAQAEVSRREEALATPGRLQRMGANQVMIISNEPQAAPVRSASVDRQFRPVVRVPIAPANTTDARPAAATPADTPAASAASPRVRARSKVIDFVPVVTIPIAPKG